MTQNTYPIGKLPTALALISVFLFCSWNPAGAEPYIAVRTGFKCSQCHVNKTGGGKRTAFGTTYAQSTLYMVDIKPSGSAAFVDGRVSETTSVGGDLRVENISLFEHESSTGEKASNSNQSTVSVANLYLQVELVPDVYTIYIDQTVSPVSANREFFLMLQNTASSVYVKAGRMLLPYGLRLIDDDAFVRNRVGFTYNRHDLGLEVGLEPGRVSVIANVTDTQLSAVGSAVFRRFRIGGSLSRNTEQSATNVVGAFGGVNFGRVTLIGESDFIKDGDVDRFSSLVELDLLVARGFNVKATYEFFDRNGDISDDRDGQERVTLGVEPFITQFVQVSAFYRINRFIPQNLAENQDQLILQFHGFF